MFFGYPGGYSMGGHVCVNQLSKRRARHLQHYVKRRSPTSAPSALRAQFVLYSLDCVPCCLEHHAGLPCSQTLPHAITCRRSLVELHASNYAQTLARTITRRRLRVQLLAATYSENPRPSHTEPPSLQWPQRNTRSENNLDQLDRYGVPNNTLS